MSAAKVTDRGIENMIATLLRVGVVASGSVVLLGGIYYLARHGGEMADYHAFRSVSGEDRKLGEIVQGAFQLRARSVIQLGVLLLIATPVLRVVFSLVGFALERDWKYVAITAIVLVVLLSSFIGAAALS